MIPAVHCLLGKKRYLLAQVLVAARDIAQFALRVLHPVLFSYLAANLFSKSSEYTS
jgi:hypothetical protein